MPDLDQIALDTVEAIAKIDPDKLKGGRVQAMAQAQCLVRDALRGVEAERDALAAKLEEIELVAMAEGAGPMMRGAIDSPPAHTIATLKAEWQAEALEVFASSLYAEYGKDDTANIYGMARLMETRAAQLRRQAEGEHHD